MPGHAGDDIAIRVLDICDTDDGATAQLFLGLAEANCNEKILAILQRNEAVLQSVDQRQSNAQDHAASRIELLSVLGRNCTLVHKTSGYVMLFES